MYYCNWNFEIKFKMPFFLKMWLQGEWSYTPSNGFKYTRFIIKATSTLTLAIFHNGSLDLQMFQSCTILKQNVFDHICTKILFGNFFFCPCVYPLMIQLQSYKRQRTLYFKGHLGLQNCFITDICSWQFLNELQAEPSVTPLKLMNFS